MERFNRTLLEMLGTLQEEDKARWKGFVQPPVQVYNCTKNNTTGYSLYQLMFGHLPRLPDNIAFGLNPEGNTKVSLSEYVKRLTESLTENYQLATTHSLKNALKNKQRFDSKVRESTLEAGDRVLVRNVGIRGKHKISDRWGKTIYTVVKWIEMSEMSLFMLSFPNIQKPKRVLHQDLLLLCGFLLSTVKVTEVKIQTEI